VHEARHEAGADRDHERRMTTRARLLARLGIVAGATLAAAAPSTARAASPGRHLRLAVTDLLGATEGRRFGHLPQAGDRTLCTGTLRDASGRAVGEVVVSGQHTGATSGTLRLEHHVLRLAGGQLVGLGGVSGDKDEFAIIGGTGTYARARGSYRARLSPDGLAGDGTGHFDITFET
jgi:hypothetical protein